MLQDAQLGGVLVSAATLRLSTWRAPSWSAYLSLLQDVFSLFDTDHSGTLSADEVRKRRRVCRNAGP